MNAAFAPAIKAHIPWAAILGNHDQESTLSRLELMQHISSMENTLSRVYPTNINSSLGGDMTEIDGFGNYHLAVRGAADSRYQNENILNIYLLDSGDYSKDHKIHGYGWIQESQKSWFKELSLKLKDDFSKAHPAQHVSVPSLVYFHIPLLETSYISSWCSIMGAKQEAIGCAQVNSGFLNAMVEVGDPHLVFNGHDHINDFCSELAENIMMCYGGGAGYHAYGKAGWSRRARVVDISLHSIWDEVQKNASASRTHKSEGAVQRREWLEVDQITTWKRLDRPPSFPLIDHEVLWSRIPVPSNGRNYCWNATLVTIVGAYSLICIIYCFWRKHPRLLRIQPLQRHHLHVYNVYKPFGYRMFKFQASP
ncbi:hypothetical protein KP509_07G063200 [Ceratopteris richardii]|nr:hypothetical protein KP509_07G063200 [Ceratopteris richardii]KAH7433307.1 hypothetical protein KP509_07G063200 [Ceratopteris richardii]